MGGNTKKALAVLTGAATLMAGIWATTVSGDSEKVVRVTARKFEYEPATIVLKKGEPVILELTSEDRLHGFNLPAFGVRQDVLPGVPMRVAFTPDKAGRFTFACDIFCGDGHDYMHGVVIVEE
jgi:cytochrome c oxidase subunit 2